MSTDKMDTYAVFEMFETINRKLDKRTNVQPDQRTVQPTETTNIDMEAVSGAIKQLENVIEEVRKPAKVEYKHRHTIDIGSSKVFISLVVMALMIAGLSYIVGEQRRNINRYKGNDLKYRYIKMQGQTNEENLYSLERQFKYGDTVKIIRKQVEKYEELVKKQAEIIERAKRENSEAERLKREVEALKK